MYTTAFTLVLFLWTKGLFVAGVDTINTYVAEDGRSYYKTPLYCNYTSLYMVNPYNSLRNTYVMVDDKNCCYLAEFRGKCCVQTDSKGSYQSCKCDPNIRCGVTTTTATTTSEPKTITTTIPPTTAPTPLCLSPTFRILNGKNASTVCPNSGVFNITILNGARSSCNAVYTVATVNGVLKPTILTAEVCKLFIELLGSAESPLKMTIGSQTYDILEPDFTVLSGPNGTAFIDVADSSILDEVAACHKNVRCPYNKDTMQGRVDLTQCMLYSWGTSNSDDYSQNGLNEVALAMNSGGCQDIPDPSSNDTLCFRAKSGANVICSNDSGGPVYCKARATEEWILMGVTGIQEECDATPEVTVLSYPG